MDEEATHTNTRRRRAARKSKEGNDEEATVGGFSIGTLKEGARGFCRLGTPFESIYQLVRVGMMWDLARDARLRGQSLSVTLGPGSMPTAEEIKAIEDIP